MNNEALEPKESTIENNLNTTPTPNNPYSQNTNQVYQNQALPDDEEKVNNLVKSIKKIIIIVVIGVLLVLATIVVLNLVSHNSTTKSSSYDQIVVDNIFKLRNDAINYYNSYKTYKDWDGDPKLQAQIKATGSIAIIRKASLQHYMVYAKLSNGEYFCADSSGFIDRINKIKENQFFCSN